MSIHKAQSLTVLYKYLNFMCIFSYNAKETRLEWKRKNDTRVERAFDKAIPIFKPRPKVPSITTAQPTLVHFRCSRASATCPSTSYRWKKKNKTYKPAARGRLSGSQDWPLLLYVLLPLCSSQGKSKERLALTHEQKAQRREEKRHFDYKVPNTLRVDYRVFRGGRS